MDPWGPTVPYRMGPRGPTLPLRESAKRSLRLSQELFWPWQRLRLGVISAFYVVDLCTAIRQLQLWLHVLVVQPATCWRRGQYQPQQRKAFNKRKLRRSAIPQRTMGPQPQGVPGAQNGGFYLIFDVF